MSVLSALISLFLLLAFTSYPAIAAVVMVGQAKPGLKMDLADEPDLLKGEEVAENVGEGEAVSEHNEDGEIEDVLMQAGSSLTPKVYRCVYDFWTGKRRCYPQKSLIPLHH